MWIGRTVTPEPLSPAQPAPRGNGSKDHKAASMTRQRSELSTALTILPEHQAAGGALGECGWCARSTGQSDPHATHLAPDTDPLSQADGGTLWIGSTSDAYLSSDARCNRLVLTSNAANSGASAPLIAANLAKGSEVALVAPTPPAQTSSNDSTAAQAASTWRVTRAKGIAVVMERIISPIQRQGNLRQKARNALPRRTSRHTQCDHEDGCDPTRQLRVEARPLIPRRRSPDPDERHKVVGK
ncbi:hypothetical protein ACSSVY_000485 [Roseovarius sp. MBR-51]